MKGTFYDIPEPIDEQDLNQVYTRAAKESIYLAEKKLKPLYSMIYIKILIDVIFALFRWHICLNRNELTYNKNLMWDGFQPPHKSKLGI